MIETKNKLQVTVTYNGDDRVFLYQPKAAVEALLNHAMNEFGIQSNRHLMSLFTEAGLEVSDKASAEDAGIEAGVLLILRQSTVKGGI